LISEGLACSMRKLHKRLPSLLYINVPALRPGSAGAYALAFVSVGIATALRLAVDPYLVGAQFVTFFPAIVITTLIGGFGAGLLCAVLSTAAADFFVLAPRWSFSFSIEDPANLADLLLFGPLASYLVIVIARMRFAIEREQAEANKDRLRLALDAAQLGWWQYDPHRRIVSGDARFKEILDVATDETPAKEIAKRVHPDDAERYWADREAALDPANPKGYAYQYRVQRSGGEVRWVETHGLPYFEGDGRERPAVHAIGTVQDITERKEREEKERLLMEEINHRAKNMLGVVQSIAKETAAQTPEDFIERFSGRIHALSATQDLLVRNLWDGVEIEDLVRAQTAPFANLIGSRIFVRGLKLRLNAASAQAIGLALHELATNAGKYGALSTDKGHVEVRWGADSGTFTMSWVERDGPPVSAPKRRGFGTIVMEAMAECSVDGAVDLEYAPSGVTWRLSCPAANALERRERENRSDGATGKVEVRATV
jgi:PAS domain S-box-containing protein